MKAVWEENAPEVDILSKTWLLGTTHSGRLSFEMIANTPYEDSCGKEVMCNLNVEGLTLSEKDTFKVSFKIANCSETISSFACQSAIDSWDWHTENTKEIGNTYTYLFTSKISSAENNLVGIKITPYGDASLIGKTVDIDIEDLEITYTPYVAGSEKTIYEAENGVYNFGTGCEYSKGIGFSVADLKAGDTVTLYYTCDTVENQWGVYSQLKIAFGYSGTCIPSLKEKANEYGQINVSGTSYSFEVTAEDIAAFTNNEGSDQGYNRMMVFGHNIILEKITVK